jgi:acyl-CoA thioesterase-2
VYSRTRTDIAEEATSIGRECTVSSVSDGIATFLSLLDLEPIEVNIFRGHHPEESRDRAFGGQVAAQALVAASRTVEFGRIHSLHAYFLRPGDPTLPILYEVDRIRDGRSFTTRRVVAIQHGAAIFTLACSFHVDEEGLEHTVGTPEVPAPDEIEPPGALPPDRAAGAPLKYLDEHGVEFRFVGGPPWMEESEPRERVQFWMRTREPIGDDPIIHVAIATFASDLTLIATILGRHGLSQWSTPLFAASLDHCMWFHRPFRVDNWLLYDQISPAAHGALGIARGRLFDEEGTLLASVLQEGLVRVGTHG